MTVTISNIPRRRLWGRRMTRGLGKARAAAYEHLMPVVGIAVEQGARGIDPLSFFKNPSPPPETLRVSSLPPLGGGLGWGEDRLWGGNFILEIGFGNGEHLIALMDQYPDAFYIGAEPFLNGIAAFLFSLQKRHPGESRDLQVITQKDPGFRRDDGLDNIRVFPDDAMLLVNALKNECIDKIYVLNPDPWPKKRHHKRRLINRENLDQFARVLKPGGALIMATDVDDLAEWMVTQCMNHPAFEWTAENSKDWQTPPAEWTETRYAFKGKKAGRRQSFLIFKKACKSSQKII